MSKLEKWKHRWFGVWKETKNASQLCPSIKDFVIEHTDQNSDKDRIAKYLETAHVVVSTSRLNFPCVLTGRIFSGSLSYRTDGIWLWPDDLAYYVREHNVCLPNEMFETMRQNGFVPPPVNQDMTSKLEWPPD